MKKVIDFLVNNKEEKYCDFQSKLIPNLDRNTVLGVRTPLLRQYAKELYRSGEYREFLTEVPHQYFEENQLHVFVISLIKDYDACIEELEKFFPYMDNWATCDQCRPKVFEKNKSRLTEKIQQWIKSDDTYTIRFAIEMLMTFYLDGDFKEEYLYLVADVKSEEYYVNMMIAWYMATALAKQWSSTVKLIEKQSLSLWVQNKSIQKARESYRITAEQKDYLNGLKLRN